MLDLFGNPGGRFSRHMGHFIAVNATCAIDDSNNIVANVYTEGLTGFAVGLFGCADLTNITADGWTQTTCPVAEVSVIYGVLRPLCKQAYAISRDFKGCKMTISS